MDDNRVDFPGESRAPLDLRMQVADRTFAIHPQTLDLSRDPSAEPYFPFLGRDTGRLFWKHLSDIPPEMQNYVFVFPQWGPSPWELARSRPLLERLRSTVMFTPIMLAFPGMYELMTQGRCAHIWWNEGTESWELNFIQMARNMDYSVIRFSPEEEFIGLFAGRRLAFVQQL